MSWSNVAAWSLALVAVILNAVLGSYNLGQMADSELRLRESLAEQARYAELLSLMQDAETGQRGYLLTGKSDYLLPYTAAEARLPEVLKDFDEGRADAADRTRLRGLVDAKFGEMRRTLAIRDTKDLATAAAAVADDTGKRLMDDFRTALKDLAEREVERVKRRAIEVDAQSRRARFANIAGAGLGLGIILAAAAMVNAELKRRQQTAEDLAVAVARIDAFFNHAPMAKAYLDEHLRVIKVNDAFAATGHKTALEAVGQPISQVNPTLAQGLVDDFQNVLTLRQPMNTRTVTDQGRTWEMTAFPVTLPNAATGLGIIGIDITRQAEAQARLRESDRTFRTLVEAVPQIVWQSDAAGRVLYFSPQWFAYTGLNEADDIDAAWTTVLHPEDRDRTVAYWQHCTAMREPYEIEYRFRRRDGTYRWFLGRARPLLDDADAVHRWLGTCTDIDDAKRLTDTLDRTVQERTARLLEQRTFLDAILNNISEGIVAADAGGNLLFNRATQEFHGLPAATLPPEQWAAHYRLYEPDGVTPMTEHRIPLRRAMAGETFRDAPMVVRPANGTERFMLCSGQPLVTAAGHATGAVVSMRDMTQRRAYEQELLNATTLLQTSNEELEKFAYVASHDLQEPLRKIQAFGDRLQRSSQEQIGEEGRDSLTRILDAAGRMRRLIEDLLAFSRVTTKTRPPEEVDLNALFKEVRDIFELRLQSENATLDVGPLPTLTGDESQLRQLFQNLVGNALKFARPDVPALIRVSATAWQDLPETNRPGPHGWRITVADNGIGFEPQYAERIFELFQRLHGRAKYDGTGLGLAIVKKIVSRHGAAVRAVGQLNQGAEFIIDWPITPRRA